MLNGIGVLLDALVLCRFSFIVAFVTYTGPTPLVGDGFNTSYYYHYYLRYLGVCLGVPLGIRYELRILTRW